MLKDESFSLLPREPLWMCSVVQEGNRAKSITVSCTAVVELWIPSTLWDTRSLLFPSESLARSKAQKTHQLKACSETGGAKRKAPLLFVPLFNFPNCISCMSEAQSEGWASEQGNRDHLQLITNYCCKPQIRTCISKEPSSQATQITAVTGALRTSLLGLFIIEHLYSS